MEERNVELSRQFKRSLERERQKKSLKKPIAEVKLAYKGEENKPISRKVRRFSKRINKKLYELVGIWFKERMKLADPDSQEAIDSLNKYDKLWKVYCNKNLKDPTKFVHEFLNICDSEDKRMRADVERVKLAFKLWNKEFERLKEEGMTKEQIEEEFGKYCKENNIIANRE